MKTPTHLNLEWTVGDFDRADFIRANRNLTLEQAAEKLRGTIYDCPVERLERISDHFHLRRRA